MSQDSSALQSKVQFFFNEILDRNQDGTLDHSEISAKQLEVLNGEKPKPGPISTQETALSFFANVSHDSDSLASTLTDALRNSEDPTIMSFSAYSAGHITRAMGLTVSECQISASLFQTTLYNFFNGEELPKIPEFESERPRASDVHEPQFTQSNFDDVSLSHVAVDLSFDFDKKRIQGVSTYKIAEATSDELVLDTRGLKIASVWHRIGEGNFVMVDDYTLGEEVENLGQALTIPIGGLTTEVKIVYATDAENPSPAVKWTEPEQTLGKKHPFLYTQGQYSHNRGWLPLQDTPMAAKTTFDITLRVPTELGLRAVASNNTREHGMIQDPKKEKGFDVYHYAIDKPVSCYLVAIAIGNLEAQQVGERSVLYTEPELAEKALKDYEEFQEYVVAAEKLFGALPFGLLDTVIMPPSFPYGGMENLGLNMNKSDIITGDGSQMPIAMHELGHSWFGNLVTNHRLEDFWLNEGLDTYAMFLIMEEVRGKEATDEEAAMNINGMVRPYETIGAFPQYQTIEASSKSCLATEKPIQDPDSFFTKATDYMKGFLFAKWLENKLGKDEFLAFLKVYLDEYSYQTVTTEDFRECLKANVDLDSAGITEKELDEWFYGMGLPADAPTINPPAFLEGDALIEDWTDPNRDPEKEFDLSVAKDWSPIAWQQFLYKIRLHDLPDAAQDVLAAQDFMSSPHKNVRDQWMVYIIFADKREHFDAMKEHIYAHPSYGSVFIALILLMNYKKTPENQALAREIYTEVKPSLHEITQKQIEAQIPGLIESK